MCDACSEFLQLLASCKLWFLVIFSAHDKVSITISGHSIKRHVFCLYFTVTNTIFILDEAKICNDDNEQPPLTQRDVDVVFIYIQTWPNRYVHFL